MTSKMSSSEIKQAKKKIKDVLLEHFKDGVLVESRGRKAKPIYVNTLTGDHLANDLFSDRIGLEGAGADKIADGLRASTKLDIDPKKQEQYEKEHQGKHKNKYKDFEYYGGEVNGVKVIFNVGITREKPPRRLLYAISPKVDEK